MKENWKTILLFPNYEISNLGRIRSKRHFVKHPSGGLKLVKGQILISNKLKSGYMMVSLGKGNNLLVHRLVAQTFIPNLKNKSCVNHLDGNKENNKLNNLQWCSYSENEQWSYKKFNKQPWCKGKKLHYSVWNKGKKLPQFSGQNHPNYKHGRYCKELLLTEQEEAVANTNLAQETRVNLATI